ncbi:hypothetical protein SLEP1_g4626 [Rubroshorea leprosula]|uniref:Uncharacterized protein n=1 Tax=Rubroshorea leprosula TaxID=152421 RepID=A0AAV5HYU2_9ROSI|nr:hypothetical protein SLEP1_g4626 [Rubroshorea leprosula]
MRGRSRERGRGSGKGHRIWTRRTTLGRAYERPIEHNRQRRGLDISQRRENRNQRKFAEWGYDEGMYKQATAFFFTNFPDEWSYAEMWKTFGKYGRVYAVYSPLRKSRNGKRFGFVRFLEVKNPKVLESQLDKIRIDGCKIWVNLAKYPVEALETKVSRIPVATSKVVKGKSYAEAVRGQEKEGSRPEWRKKEEGEAWVGMEYNVEEEDLEWLRDCYVGVAHSVEIVPILQERFYMEGYFTCRLRAMGGKLILLDCEDKGELKELVQGAASWLSQWFSEIKPWSPITVAKERFVWLRCLGVPLHAWGPVFFESMVAAWGKFISLDDNTSKKRRFDVARILISTSIMESISVKRQIKVNGVLYNLRFTEEEMSNSLFSMKYDFLLSFKSDTEASSAGDGDTVGSIPDQARKNKRVSAIPVSEAHFEFEGDMQEDIGQKKKDTIYYSWMGEEESIEVVADSLQECLAGSDVGSRDEEVTPVAQLQSISPFPSKGGGPNVETKDCETTGSSKHNHLEAQQGISSFRHNLKVKKGKKRVGLSREESREASTDLEVAEGLGGERRDLSGKEGMATRSKPDIMKKKKKALLCRSVYQKANILGLMSLKKKTKSGARPKKAPSQELPSFMPNSSYSVAGGSVGDSGIANCNRMIKEHPSRRIAAELWDFAKQIGVTAEDEVETLRNLEEMEKRDREAKELEIPKTGRKKRHLRELVKKEKVDFLAIQETKLGGLDNRISRSVWGTDEVDWVAKDAVGMSGGIACFWNSKVIRAARILEGEHFIGIKGLWCPNNEQIVFINVYSPCQLPRKRVLWEELRRLIQNGGEKICIMGDFNTVRKAEERKGSSGVTRDMREFDSFIQAMNLVDMPLVGRKFIWYQVRGNYMSRIDRFLLSEGWMSKWGEARQWGLRRTVSDHCLILLKHQTVEWGPKPFRFFDSWLEQEGCGNLIKEVWNDTQIQGWAGFRLKEKLKATKEALRKWSKNLIPALDLKVNNASSTIARIDMKGEVAQLSEEEIDRRREAFIQIWESLKSKESMLQQKSRKVWLAQGDANTKFFHNCVKGRWRRAEMNSIQIKGVQIRDAIRVKEEIARYFEELYAEEKKIRPTLDGLAFKQLTWEENVNLISPFNEEEIKIVVGECDSSKAPGPDGFNFRFVKSEWDVIKADVVSFLQEFQTNGKLVRGLNTSFTVLVPKVENPVQIEEYRPISLVGVMYKILAKLLANRLQEVLGNKIGEQQMAFLKGRQLMDGVVIANEVIDEAKKKRKKAFLFKIDFEKAYDKVSWSFLDHMMQKMGFCEKWRLWIQECLRSSLVSILVNGSPSRQFNVSRGLRQGDPLSPFLFLIIAEGLNGLVTEAIKNGKLEGVEVGNRSFSISHLQYADDTILFGKATEENVWAMKGILRAFELVSGLKINFNKSQLVGIGVEDDWLNKMSWVLCCKKGTLPFKYLSITIGGSCKRFAFWKPMVDIFERKLATWKGRYLSLGGRITLINSVLSSLPVFWMSMYLVPKGTILLLDKIRRKFLWGGAEREKRINWVKWENVCKEKQFGGLGVKDLRKFNLALLGKWWGRLVRGDNGLWGKVIFEKYGKVGESTYNWLREGFNYGSAWWRDICRLSDMEGNKKGWLADGLEIRVGDGKDMSFWWDEWCGGVHSKDGIYTTKSAYQALTRDHRTVQQSPTISKVWQEFIPSKISVFAWQVLQDKIPTKMNLLKRGIIQDITESKCVLCGLASEDSNHLFIHCKIAWELWNSCYRWWGSKQVLDKDCGRMFEQHPFIFNIKEVRGGWECIWFSVVWSIWLARNEKLFRGKEVEAGRLLELVQVRAFKWIKGKRRGSLFTVSDWILNPVSCLNPSLVV